MAAKSFQGANECTKAVAAYKRLLPMMKKGTKDYTKVQKASTDLCKPAAAPKHSLKFVSDALYGDHLRGLGHPESPDRVEVVASRLRAGGFLDRTLAAARRNRRRDRARSRAAVSGAREARRSARFSGRGTSQRATFSSIRGSLAVARRAAGGAIAAVEAAASGRGRSSPSCGRPGITPSPRAEWVFASLIMPRSPRAPTRRISAAGY